MEYQRSGMDLTVDHPSDTAQKYLQEHVKTLVGTSAIFPFLSKYFYLFIIAAGGGTSYWLSSSVSQDS